MNKITIALLFTLACAGCGQAVRMGLTTPDSLISHEGDKTVQQLISSAFRIDDMHPVRYEAIYRKDKKVYLLRGQQRQGETRHVFHVTVDPSSRLAIVQVADSMISSQDLSHTGAAAGRNAVNSDTWRGGNASIQTQRQMQAMEKAQKAAPMTYSPENVIHRRILQETGKDWRQAMLDADKQLPQQYGYQSFYYRPAIYTLSEKPLVSLEAARKEAEGKSCTAEIVKAGLGQPLESGGCIKIASDLQEIIGKLLTGADLNNLDALRSISTVITIIEQKTDAVNIEDKQIKVLAELAAPAWQERVSRGMQPITRDAVQTVAFKFGKFSSCEKTTIDAAMVKSRELAADHGLVIASGWRHDDGREVFTDCEAKEDYQSLSTTSKRPGLKDFLQQNARIFYQARPLQKVSAGCETVTEILMIDGSTIFEKTSLVCLDNHKK